MTNIILKQYLQRYLTKIFAKSLINKSKTNPQVQKSLRTSNKIEFFNFKYLKKDFLIIKLPLTLSPYFYNKISRKGFYFYANRTFSYMLDSENHNYTLFVQKDIFFFAKELILTIYKITQLLHFFYPLKLQQNLVFYFYKSNKNFQQVFFYTEFLTLNLKKTWFFSLSNLKKTNLAPLLANIYFFIISQFTSKNRNSLKSLLLLKHLNKILLVAKISLFICNYLLKIKKSKYINEYNFLNQYKIKSVIYFKPFSYKIRVIRTIYLSTFKLSRPLLSITRFETVFICKTLKLPVYPDKSNFQVQFLRNRVRKQILPTIRILLNPQFDTILCNFSDSFSY